MAIANPSTGLTTYSGPPGDAKEKTPRRQPFVLSLSKPFELKCSRRPPSDRPGALRGALRSPGGGGGAIGEPLDVVGFSTTVVRAALG
jgi:hypothetical protein